MFHFLRSGGSGGDQTVIGMTHEPVAKRPTIALALGGGAARGFAHIGVIRTLVAKGFRPDIIAGTSIGAVIGGCYAAGKLDGIEEWARTLTRRRLFSYLDVSLGGLGLISGTKLFETLSESLGDIAFTSLNALVCDSSVGGCVPLVPVRTSFSIRPRPMLATSNSPSFGSV